MTIYSGGPRRRSPRKQVFRHFSMLGIEPFHLIKPMPPDLTASLWTLRVLSGCCTVDEFTVVVKAI